MYLKLHISDLNNGSIVSYRNLQHFILIYYKSIKP